MASLSCAMNECYPRGQSDAYNGRRKCTVNGHACDSWRKYDIQGQDHEYCRDPGGEKGAPWCHVTAKSVPATWEYCDVPICDDKRLDTQRCNEEYIESCELPDMKVKVDHDCTGIESLPVYSTDVGSTMHFRCSYLQTNIKSSSDYCPVQVCQSDGLWTTASISCGENECYEPGRSDKYQGHRACSRSGRQCQAWLSQYPHTHDLQAASFPGGNMTGSYCRDPDGMRGAPWCFTLDPDLEWEDCSIDLCDEIELVSTKCSSFNELEQGIGNPAPSEKYLYQSKAWDPFLLGLNDRPLSTRYTLHSNTNPVPSIQSQMRYFKTMASEQPPIITTHPVPSLQSQNQFQTMGSEQLQISTTYPVPLEQSTISTADPVPSEQSPISTNYPVPSEQSPISTIHLVPSEQSPITTTDPIPSEEFLVKNTHPVLSEQSPISTTYPVPSEQSQITTTDPVPSEQSPISTTHLIPSEQSTISTTHLVPPGQSPNSSTFPVPSELSPINTTHPVHSDEFLVKITHPVHSEQSPISSSYSVPTKQSPISYAHPVPSEQSPISTNHPVPSEQYPISTTHPVPSEQSTISTTHLIPPGQSPISIIHSVPSEQSPISTTYPVPSEQSPISTNHPVPTKQSPISYAHLVSLVRSPISNAPPLLLEQSLASEFRSLFQEQNPIINTHPVSPDHSPISNFQMMRSGHALNSDYQHTLSEQILQNSFKLSDSQTGVHINDQPKSIEQIMYNNTLPAPSKQTRNSIIRSTGGRTYLGPSHSKSFFDASHASSDHTRLKESYTLDKNLVTQGDREDDTDTWSAVPQPITNNKEYVSKTKIRYDLTTFESASIQPPQPDTMGAILSSSENIAPTSELENILQSTYNRPAEKLRSVGYVAGKTQMFPYHSSSIPNGIDWPQFRTKNSVIQDQVLSTVRSSSLYLGLLPGTQMVDTTVLTGFSLSDKLTIYRSEGNRQASQHISEALSSDISWSKSSFIAIPGTSTSEMGMAVSDSLDMGMTLTYSTKGTDHDGQYKGISNGIPNQYERSLYHDSNMPLGHIASNTKPTIKFQTETKDVTTTTKDDVSTLFYFIQPSYLSVPSSIITATSPLPTTNAADRSVILSSVKPVKSSAYSNNADRLTMFEIKDISTQANVNTQTSDHTIDKLYVGSKTTSHFSLRSPTLLPVTRDVLSANGPVNDVSGHQAKQTMSSSKITKNSSSFDVELSTSTVIVGDVAKQKITQHKTVSYKCLVDLNFTERERFKFKLNVWTFRQATHNLSKLTPLTGNLHRKNENEISCGRHCSHVYRCDMFAFDFETNTCALFSLEPGDIVLDCTAHRLLSCYTRCITVA